MYYYDRFVVKTIYSYLAFGCNILLDVLYSCLFVFESERQGIVHDFPQDCFPREFSGGARRAQPLSCISQGGICLLPSCPALWCPSSQPGSSKGTSAAADSGMWPGSALCRALLQPPHTKGSGQQTQAGVRGHLCDTADGTAW